METNMAILIADLTGYTALTEAHGASTAANIISRYLTIVRKSLIGKSILHQCVGDEVMIVSNSPDDLINTAITLIQNCSKEHLFLQLHGGLHYGNILYHNKRYFGSPVNHTARLAAKAIKGTVWCSSAFINALKNPSAYVFSFKGRHGFKNVAGKIDVFEVILNKTSPYYIDPVCRMLIHKKEAAIPHPQDSSIFFCSSHCLRTSLKTVHF